MFTLKEFLHLEVQPALGCTEPGAVALAVASAHRELSSVPEETQVQITVSDNIMKNGMAVGIPGTNGAKGNHVAAALALICGNPDFGLEVLRDSREADVSLAIKLVDSGRILITCDPEEHGVYVDACLKSQDGFSRCVISGYHSNITRIEHNSQIVYDQLPYSGQEAASGSLSALQSEMSLLSFDELVRVAEETDPQVLEYLWAGIEMNTAIAEYALKADHSCGLDIGRTLMRLMQEGDLSDDTANRIKSYCCAASDARMAGAQLPVMSSAGSGNHGITAILPIALVGKEQQRSRSDICRAVAVSHLITSMVKAKTGRLTPVCGCAVAAGPGAAAGLVYLQGGTAEQCKTAAQTILSSTVGMICDGAKESCSLKVGTAAAEAYLASVLSLQGVGVNSPQGVVDTAIEKTATNIGKVNKYGMEPLDKILIEILNERTA